MVVHILHNIILSGYLDRGYVGCLYIGGCALFLHVSDRVVGLEVDLVNTVLVNHDAVEVEFDRKT